MVSRRGFLQRLGIGAIAVTVAPDIIKQAAAPLFIPSERLDFGVPKPVLVLPDAQEMTDLALAMLKEKTAYLAEYDRASRDAGALTGKIPMVMLQTTFYPSAGGRLWEGSTAYVDEKTAGRWVDYGIAAPAPGYHVEPDTTRRVLEAAQQSRYSGDFRDAEDSSTGSLLSQGYFRRGVSDARIREHLLKLAAEQEAMGDPVAAWMA